MGRGNEKQKWSRREVKALLGESRALLRRARKRISEEKRDRVESALESLALALQEGEAHDRPAEELQSLVTRELDFARKGKFREFAESIGIALVIALVLRAFVVEAFQIPSGSMEPTLLVGDRLFVSKSTLGVRVPFSTRYLVRWGDVERGDVLVFVFPSEEVRTQIALGRLNDAILSYRRATGQYPPSLDTLLDEGAARGLRSEMLVDAWGTPFRYSRRDDGFSLRSAGRDETFGSDFDWDVRESAFQGVNTSCVDPSSVSVQKDYIKRIIAVGGDEVELRDHVWYVNGEALQREELGPIESGRRRGGPSYHAREWTEGGTSYLTYHAGLQPDFGPVTVRPEYFFAVGDNRDHSSDSRCWGQVPVEHAKGRALFLFFSAGNDGVRFERIFNGVR